VRSLDVVASGGQVWRIEPSDGPTDPAAYAAKHPDRTLRQDDRFFDAARVGVGCLGVIHSLMVEVTERYWLREVRRLRPWEEVREELRARDVLRRHRHYEVYISPYRLGKPDDHCLVTTRDPTAGPARRPRARRRNSAPEFFATLPITPRLINLATDLFPRRTPRMLDRALSALADEEYTNRSFKVLNIGTANLLPAYSSEIGVPVDERGSHVEAVERIAAVAARHRRLGSVYQTSPISLRFVKASSAPLSMMEGRDTMMIELIQMTRTEGGFELLGAYEEELYDLGGRPHWGQFNTLTGSHDLVRALYPRLDEWLEVHDELNASGVFDSPFSKRVGISRPRVRAAGVG
jgi:L-gulono-1,4-lactone dehydrogenase